MKFIFFVLLSMNVEAGLLDFLHIEQANNAYQKQDYKVATEKFADINNDAAQLNQANSLYKQGLYEKALEKYQSVKQKDLDFNRLYNTGNTYAKLKKIDEAIDSYTEALKLKQDKDALFNLKMLKQQKAKRKKNEQAKNSKDNKKQKKGKEQEKQQQSSKKNSKKRKDKDKKDSKKEQRQQEKKLDAIKQQRWEKSLNKDLRTLLIPLNKQNNNDDDKKNLW
ncbi:TPR domain protein in aerotolerance operon [uncultured Candidatus Thioglobus sp.]|nr:TPR domain protein in aerotolerance operon [uncultured Candidatus Thioglobus sp.]